MLRADAAAVVGDEPEHGVLDPPILGVPAGAPAPAPAAATGAGDVDVHVALGDVTEQPGPRLGCDSRDAGRDRLDERGQDAQRQGDVHLDGRAEGVDRFGVPFSVGPQGAAAARVARQGRVLDPRQAGDGVRQRLQHGGPPDQAATTDTGTPDTGIPDSAAGDAAGGDAAPRVDAGLVRDLDQQVGRVPAPQRPGQVAGVDHQLQAGGEHQLGGRERGQAVAQLGGRGHGPLHRGEAEQPDRPRPGGRYQPDPHRRDHAERPFAAREQGRQVVAGVVPGQAGEMGDDAAVTQDGLHAEQLGPGVPVAQDAQAAGVRRDGAADRGAVPAGEVHAVGEAGGGRRPVQAADQHARADGGLRGRRVDRQGVAEPAQAQHDLPAGGHPAADEPGVAALGHQRGPVPGADLHDRGHPGGAHRPDDGGRPADEAPGPVPDVAGDDGGVGQHARVAYRITQCFQYGVSGHGSGSSS